MVFTLKQSWVRARGGHFPCTILINLTLDIDFLLSIKFKSMQMIRLQQQQTLAPNKQNDSKNFVDQFIEREQQTAGN